MGSGRCYQRVLTGFILWLGRVSGGRPRQASAPYRDECSVEECLRCCRDVCWDWTAGMRTRTEDGFRREVRRSGGPGSQATQQNRTLREEVAIKEKQGGRRAKRGVSQRSLSAMVVLDPPTTVTLLYVSSCCGDAQP